MQINITLSNKEKRYYFFYLLAMLLFGVLVLSLVVFHKYESPFANSDINAVQKLQEKAKFDQTQESFQKKTVDSAFIAVKKLDPEKATTLELREAQDKVEEITMGFLYNGLSDPRKNAFKRIGKFYSMFLDDKRSSITIKSNIEEFTRQLNECDKNYDNRRSEVTSRQNAEISSGR